MEVGEFRLRWERRRKQLLGVRDGVRKASEKGREGEEQSSAWKDEAGPGMPGKERRKGFTAQGCNGVQRARGLRGFSGSPQSG